MKDKRELSVFGWIVVLSVIAGTIYGFSLPVSNELTVFNVLNIIARIAILCTLCIYEVRGFFTLKLITLLKSIIPNIILTTESFVYNIEVFNKNPNDLVSLYFIAIVTAIIVTFPIATMLLFCTSIDDYQDGYIVKEAVKNFFKQNFFVNLMFKQPESNKKEKMKM